jgi:hypothetical protein
MNETKAIIAIVVGCAAIVLAFVGKQFYYGYRVPAKRPAPLWYGRAVFLLVGMMFLLIGIAFFFTSR